MVASLSDIALANTPLASIVPAAAEVEYWKGIFSIAALVVAVIGFLAVIAYLLLRKNQNTYERARHLPLEDD